MAAECDQFQRAFFQFVEQRHSLFLGKTAFQFLHDLVVIRADGSVLGVEIGQFRVVFHESFVHDQHLERLPEKVRLDENRPCGDSRFLEHREETVVFLLIETDGVSEYRRIVLGVPSPFLLPFFCHITLDFSGVTT
ncbi:uncharacterized protein BN494_01419 [Eggerthella sp. CAG:1427]|nr:uncharacterized protein BN494_01419 [Eggerthella sp. CAG:1427]